MKIFRLIKTRNGGFHGPRYLYEVRDGSGRKLSSASDNKNYVAGIVGRHEIPNRPGQFMFSLNGMTQTPGNLGKATTSGGRSSVYGIALIETVPIGNEFRPVIRTSAGDDFDEKGTGVDWSKLPKEYRAAIVATGVDIETFHTVKPEAGGNAAFWIEDADADGDPPAVEDAITREFDEAFSGQDIATPEAASSTIAGDKCNSKGPGELYCQREPGHDRQCAAKSVDATLGVEVWDDPNVIVPPPSGDAIKAELKARVLGKGHSTIEFIHALDASIGVGPEDSRANDPAFVERVDALLTTLTAEAYLKMAFAIYLARETEDGTTTVTDVRQLSRARRKLVVQIDEHARRLCKEFTKRIFGDDRDAETHLQFADMEDAAAGSVTPESASHPVPDEPTEALKDPAIMADADEEPPEPYEANCYKCGATFYTPEPPPLRPDCGACTV